MMKTMMVTDIRHTIETLVKKSNTLNKERYVTVYGNVIYTISP